MSYQIRKANQNDFPGLEKLLDGYYQGNWRGSTEKLKRDLNGGIFEILVAENDSKELVGFLVWKLTYDLNWCFKGGEVIDFYVSPTHRGCGAALLLTIGMAKESQKRGAAFLKGGSENQVCIAHSGEWRCVSRTASFTFPGARLDISQNCLGKIRARLSKICPKRLGIMSRNNDE